MMVTNDIHFSAMRFGIKGANPSQILRNLSYAISQDTQLGPDELRTTLDNLMKASLIGIGEGVGVFDWVSEGVDASYVLCGLLETPVSFPSVDDSPIDIILVLISPEKNGPLHLQYLSRLTRLFREQRLLQDLRSVTCVDGMKSVLSPENRKLLAA